MIKIRILLLGVLFVACSQKNQKEISKNNELVSVTSDERWVINLYDAFGEDKQGLIKDFGFSCIVKYNGKTILFDSGTNADIFKQNVEALNIDLSKIDFVVASHAHFDHINGFDYLLQINPNVKIYFPFDLFWGANVPFDISGTDTSVTDSLETRMQYFKGDYKDYHFKQTGRFWNANIEFIKENIEIEPGIKLIATTSPHMGYFNKYPHLGNRENEAELSNAKLVGLNEISLSLDTEEGEVLFVGCSHSTVEKIIAETKSFTKNDIAMVYGGYHLLPYNQKTLRELAFRLKNDLNVKKVAPAHCTGHLAFKTLQDCFKENYVFAGLGEKVAF